MHFLLSMPGGGEIFFIWVMIFLIVSMLIPFIFFIVTLKSTLEIVSPENRIMQPNYVWLLLIPIFNVIWIFVVVIQLSDSIANEARSKKILLDEQRPGFNIGLAMSIVNIVAMIIPFGSIATLVCWIIYWVQIAGYKKKIAYHNSFNIYNTSNSQPIALEEETDSKTEGETEVDEDYEKYKPH